MSTRATYDFKATDWRPRATIYIHHDGYEAGAAFYLFNAWKSGGRLTAESLIRGNDGAELTSSADAHGDTEYRYTIDGDKLTVEARHTLIEFGSYPKGWKTIFDGDWVEFVNKNLDAKWLDGEKPELRRVKIEYATEVHTPQTLHDKLNDDLMLLGCWTVGAWKDHPDSANMQNLKARIARMKDMLATFGGPAWAAKAA